MRLAEEHHFGRAPERLAFAQPALSQQIRRLEAQLRNVPLFLPSSRGIELTAAGEAFLGPATRSLEAARPAASAARATHGGLSGDLRLAVNGDVEPMPVPPSTSSERRRPPRQALRGGDFDAALVWEGDADGYTQVPAHGGRVGYQVGAACTDVAGLFLRTRRSPSVTRRAPRDAVDLIDEAGAPRKLGRESRVLQPTGNLRDLLVAKHLATRSSVA